jgi:predicted PurR-regulated permease PerM
VETILVILLVVVVLVLFVLSGAVVWLAMRVSNPMKQNNEQIANLAGKLDAIQKQVDGSLQSVTSQVSVFGEVKESLG